MNQFLWNIASQCQVWEGPGVLAFSSEASVQKQFQTVCLWGEVDEVVDNLLLRQTHTNSVLSKGGNNYQM